MINKNIKKTGIPRLDDCLKGGIPIGKTLLFYASPFVESDVFVIQAASKNLEEGEVCYFVATSYGPDMVRANFEEYGWDTSRYERRLEIVDAYSALMGAPSAERFQVKDPQSIESFDETVSAIIDMLSPGDMLMFSSLSAIFDQCGSDSYGEVLDYARRWNKMAVLKGGVVVYNFTDREYGPEILDQVKNGLCNATVQVGGLGSDTIYGHYFKPHSCDWARLSEQPTLFKIEKPGGVTANIPKILVTGPQGCGKSTFVKTAASLSSTKCVSVDRMGTTIAGDHAHVMIKGFSMDLFGTPGQKRFIPTLKAFAVDAMGIVMMVDAADPRSFEAASEMLYTANDAGVPYIIAANKCDVKGALDGEGIRKKMGVPESVPVVSICASKKADVERALDLLTRMITDTSSTGPDDKFKVVVSDLRRTMGVRAAAVVSMGGVLKAAEMPEGVQGERLAFATSALLNTAVWASENLSQGMPGRLTVEIDGSKLVVMGVGEKNLLVVLAESMNGAPLVQVEMDRAAKKIKEILGERA